MTVFDIDFMQRLIGNSTVNRYRQESTDFEADDDIVAFDGDVSSFSRLQARMQIKVAELACQSPVSAILCGSHSIANDWLKFECMQRQELA